MSLPSNDGYTGMSDVVWDTIVRADTNPALHRVELLFGGGDAPWNGRDRRDVTYYLTSVRPDLVLMSHRSCEAMCNDNFPDCFRVDRNRWCGRRFAKSRSGTRAAIGHALRVHAKSVAREQALWAVLVLYDARGRWRRVRTWPNVAVTIAEKKGANAREPVYDDDSPGGAGERYDSGEEESCSLSFMQKCATVWRVPLLAFFGLLMLALLLVLVHVLTRKEPASVAIVEPDDTSTAGGGDNGAGSPIEQPTEQRHDANDTVYLPGHMSVALREPS